MEQLWRGPGLVAASSLVFAIMAVVARTLSGRVPAAQLGFIRFAVGLGCAGLLFAYERKWPRFRRPGLLVLRGLWGAAAVYCYFLAIHALGVGPATLLNYVSPVYAAVFASFFLGERPKVSLWLGLVIATAGAGLVAYSTLSGPGSFSWSLGAVAGLISPLLAGAAMTSVRALRQDTDAPTVFLAFCGVGALLGLPLSWSNWTPLSPALLWPSVAVGLLAFVGQMLFTYAFGYVSASAGSAVTQLTPVFSWALAALFLDEVPRPLTAAGAVVCVLGVLLGLWGPKKKPAMAVGRGVDSSLV